MEINWAFINNCKSMSLGGSWEKIMFCKHLPMNQLINVKISTFSPKFHVWINIIVRKVAQKSEQHITVWTMWRLKTLLVLQVWQRIKIMKQTQDRMADSVLRLRLQIFSTSIKHSTPGSNMWELNCLDLLWKGFHALSAQRIGATILPHKMYHKNHCQYCSKSLETWQHERKCDI